VFLVAPIAICNVSAAALNPFDITCHVPLKSPSLNPVILISEDDVIPSCWLVSETHLIVIILVLLNANDSGTALPINV
tara:strand:+ start:591 stop:824 length:234 start_codon:yes stop_codon:yes gene_type:complete